MLFERGEVRNVVCGNRKIDEADKKFCDSDTVVKEE